MSTSYYQTSVPSLLPTPLPTALPTALSDPKIARALGSEVWRRYYVTLAPQRGVFKRLAAY